MSLSHQIIFFLSATLFLHNVSANEREWQSHESISNHVEVFLLQEAGSRDETQVKVGSLDKRLKLVDCPNPLSVFWPPGGAKSGNVTVGVSCESGKPWKIYLQAKVSIIRDIAVLSRAVVKGDILRTDMIRYERQSVGRNQKIHNVDGLLGYRFKRAFDSGRAMTATMLELPLLVERGDNVTIIAGTSTLSVKMKGEALTDGSKGKVIRVRNLSSERIVQGEVIAKGLVRTRH